MALMPLPEHRSVDPHSLRNRIEDHLARTPMQWAWVCHCAGPGHVTEVPYVMMVVAGRLWVRESGRPVRELIPGTAVLFLPGSVVPVRGDVDATYLRCTWDTTHTFVAVAAGGGFKPRIDGCLLPGAPDPLVDSLVERCRAFGNRPDRDGIALSYLSALFGEARERLGHGQDERERRRTRWDDLQRYLTRHFRNCTRARAARACGVTEGHVGRLVRQHAGCSFVEFLRDLRLQHAESLLREEQLEVQEIAARCGFTNTSHFIRLFKARTGRTPAAWRAAASR